MREAVSNSGSANKALALNARQGTLSLLAQPLCFLREASFKGNSLCETAMLWHTLLHPFEDWRERDRRSHHRQLPRYRAAMGTMCTRNQRRARTKSSPEQKVNGRLTAGDGPRRTLLL
jgi:hypothetical protein